MIVQTERQMSHNLTDIKRKAYAGEITQRIYLAALQIEEGGFDYLQRFVKYATKEVLAELASLKVIKLNQESQYVPVQYVPVKVTA